MSSPIETSLNTILFEGSIGRQIISFAKGNDIDGAGILPALCEGDDRIETIRSEQHLALMIHITSQD